MFEMFQSLLDLLNRGEDAVLVNETQEYAGYRITLLGAVTGRNISEYLPVDEKGQVEDDRFYTAVAIERADVCLILIDAQEGVTEQDTKVAGMAHDAGKASIIVVNKWDLIEKDGKTMDRMRADVRRDLSYMAYAPILFISAATGQRVDRLLN